MNRITKSQTVTVLLFFCFTIFANAQYTEVERPAEWKNLVYGGRFMDRFLPIPVIGNLTFDTWGAANVIPRYVKNGIEDNEWSYWGGNILQGEDGQYNLFVCRWREDSPKGHMEWPNSLVVHAVSNNIIGPYKVLYTIGKGHNPEAFRLKDGRIVIYVINGYYISDNINGPWEYNKFEFDNRDRPIIEGLSNLSFVRREDGSFIMVCRGGGIWISRNGISPYFQITDKSVYPKVEGRFEDPVIWRTDNQYHLIVNDWYGRIAYYLRSKDGIKWKVDPGEAYSPGITKYEDGTVEDWFKYERIKIFQDEFGRPVQANFAVIDTLKHEDHPNDKHSSKNISIPLVKERLIEIINKEIIDENTKFIQVKIKAEDDFKPHKDIDIKTLFFGAPEEVDFGRGGKVIKTKKSGDDLILIFDGLGNRIDENNFVAKLLGKTKEGKLLFGYARLPWINYNESVLSARMPEIKTKNNNRYVNVEVQNFGQVKSKKSEITIELLSEGQKSETLLGVIPELEPFQNIHIEFPLQKELAPGSQITSKTTILTKGQNVETLEGKVKFTSP